MNFVLTLDSDNCPPKLNPSKENEACLTPYPHPLRPSRLVQVVGNLISSVFGNECWLFNIFEIISLSSY